jgi:hypothetical protein
VDYISKWVEATPCQAVDAKHAHMMFHEIIFPHFGTPRMVICDGGSHFVDKTFRSFLKELGNSIPPANQWSSRNIKQANQKYSAEDGQ